LLELAATFPSPRAAWPLLGEDGFFLDPSEIEAASDTRLDVAAVWDVGFFFTFLPACKFKKDSSKVKSRHFVLIFCRV